MKFSRFVSAALCSAILASPAGAFDYNLISAGQVYDYDVVGQFTNPAVKVLDKRGGKVLVQFLEGDREGQVEWVSPAALLSMDESRKQETDNIVAGIGVGIAIVCAISGSCEDKGKSADTVTVPASLPDGIDRKVSVKNDCAEDVRFWIAYYRDGHFYGSGRPWILSGGGSVSDLQTNGTAVTADNEMVFFYAESTKSKMSWSGDGKSWITMDGARYDMRQFDMGVVDGYYQMRLTCD